MLNSPIELSIFIIVALLIVAFIAGYIDTLVGGGGLITIPALMLVGVPPIYALGTNKLQAVAGSGTAMLTLFLQNKLRFSDVKWLMLVAFFGACVGAILVQFVKPDVLNFIVPAVIVLIAAYFIFVPTTKLSESEAKMSKQTYGCTAVPLVGFYDGMFGPGTGSFFLWAGVSLRGQSIIDSAMTAKALNFATNIAALIVFIYYSKVLWQVGLLMMIGQALGARLGAKSLMTINPGLLRYLVIAICFVILIAWVCNN